MLTDQKIVLSSLTVCEQDEYFTKIISDAINVHNVIITGLQKEIGVLTRNLHAAHEELKKYESIHMNANQEALYKLQTLLKPSDIEKLVDYGRQLASACVDDGKILALDTQFLIPVDQGECDGGSQKISKEVVDAETVSQVWPDFMEKEKLVESEAKDDAPLTSRFLHQEYSHVFDRSGAETSSTGDMTPAVSLPPASLHTPSSPAMFSDAADTSREDASFCFLQLHKENVEKRPRDAQDRGLNDVRYVMPLTEDEEDIPTQQGNTELHKPDKHEQEQWIRADNSKCSQTSRNCVDVKSQEAGLNVRGKGRTQRAGTWRLTPSSQQAADSRPWQHSQDLNDTRLTQVTMTQLWPSQASHKHRRKKAKEKKGSSVKGHLFLSDSDEEDELLNVAAVKRKRIKPNAKRNVDGSNLDASTSNKKVGHTSSQLELTEALQLISHETLDPSLSATVVDVMTPEKVIVPGTKTNMDGPNYKYIPDHVPRKQEERKKLPAFTCAVCDKWFDYICDGEEKAERIRVSCRHKAYHTPPKTPQNFWETKMPSTAECQERGYHGVQTQLSPLPLRRKGRKEDCVKL